MFSFYVNDDSSGRHTNKELEDAPDICNYATAFAHFFDNLESRANIDRDDILYVCHRVVHGGDFYEPRGHTEESLITISNVSLTWAPCIHTSDHLFPTSYLWANTDITAQLCGYNKANVSNLKHDTSLAYFDASFHHDIPATHILLSHQSGGS